eukprot:c14840_g1_i1 orf=271-1143(+)
MLIPVLQATMWSRGTKLESLSLHFQREFARLLCPPCRSYCNAKRPIVQLHNSVTKANLFLVGIDHASPKSAEFVRHIIRDLMPNVVAVELCRKRGKAVLSGEERKSMTWKDIFAIKGSLTQKLLTFIITSLYDELAATGLKPGEELRVAILEGLAIGASISYIDQNMNVTLRRAAQEFSLMELIRFFLRRRGISRQYPLLSEALSTGDALQCAEAMMDPKARAEAIEVAEKYFPGLVEAMLHERNKYMVKNLRKLQGRIVSVVGALHLEGMCKLWQETEVEWHKGDTPLS